MWSPPSPLPSLPGCDGRSMWTIISLVTLSSPICILLTQKWLRPQCEAARGGYTKMPENELFSPGGGGEGEDEEGRGRA